MRGRVEVIVHVAACGLLAWVLWECVRAATGHGVEIVEQRALRPALVRWTTAPSAPAVHVRLADVPSVGEREWLRALRGAGSRVTWSYAGGGALPATGLDAGAIVDPRGAIRVAVAGPAGSRAVIGDRLGVIDSGTVGREGVVLRVPGPVSAVRATVHIAGDSVTARGGAIDSLVMRRVLVLARAGWEGKYVARALQDEGWAVDVHFVVAPKNDVVSARLPAIDTATYAAVVAVDSGIVGQSAALTSYVRSGGGLVVSARDMGVLGAVAPGTAGAVVRGGATSRDVVSRAGLTLVPIRLGAAEGDTAAVALERRDSLVAVAARRVGSGRVAAIGYTDTWRWRMAGGDSGMVAHREWWAGVVAAVAYAPVVARPPVAGGDPAPLASTVERLGLPSVVPLGGERAVGDVLPGWVFVVVVVGVVAEWASRRMRGRR